MFQGVPLRLSQPSRAKGTGKYADRPSASLPGVSVNSTRKQTVGTKPRRWSIYLRLKPCGDVCLISSNHHSSLAALDALLVALSLAARQVQPWSCLTAKWWPATRHVRCKQRWIDR
ncbi:unnamed protein product [Discosporangium mesarthrocarpum]